MSSEQSRNSSISEDVSKFDHNHHRGNVIEMMYRGYFDQRCKKLFKIFVWCEDLIPEGHSSERNDDNATSPKSSDGQTESSGRKVASKDVGKGVPISEIRQGFDRWGPPPLPPVKPSSSHTVLYKVGKILCKTFWKQFKTHVVIHDIFELKHWKVWEEFFKSRCVQFSLCSKVPWRHDQMPDPFPNNPYDRWDQDHVRMPHSSESLYPVQEVWLFTFYHYRFYSAPLKCSLTLVLQTEDEKGLRIRWELIQEALLRTVLSSHQLESAILSYNSRYNEKWNFSTLHALFDEVKFCLKHFYNIWVIILIILPKLWHRC